MTVEGVEGMEGEVTWHLLAHPDHPPSFDDAAIAQEMALLSAVHEEDMATCRRVHAGLASGRIDRFRLTGLEAPIADFQRWVAARGTVPEGQPSC